MLEWMAAAVQESSVTGGFPNVTLPLRQKNLRVRFQHQITQESHPSLQINGDS
jgi:hypothetical protein